MSTATIDSDLMAQVFRLRTPLLSEGRSNTILASSKGDAGAMKISARNKISGRITDIEKGSAMATVMIDARDCKLTTAITRQAADDLQLAPGDQVTALFKSTEVLLQKA